MAYSIKSSDIKRYEVSEKEVCSLYSQDIYSLVKLIMKAPKYTDILSITFYSIVVTKASKPFVKALSIDSLAWISDSWIETILLSTLFSVIPSFYL
jgi:hypothetical protein